MKVQTEPNLSRFGSRNVFSTQFHNKYTWFCIEKLKKHVAQFKRKWFSYYFHILDREIQTNLETVAPTNHFVGTGLFSFWFFCSKLWVFEMDREFDGENIMRFRHQGAENCNRCHEVGGSRSEHFVWEYFVHRVLDLPTPQKSKQIETKTKNTKSKNWSKTMVLTKTAAAMSSGSKKYWFWCVLCWFSSHGDPFRELFCVFGDFPPREATGGNGRQRAQAPSAAQGTNSLF